MPTARFDLVGLVVADLAASLDFYRRLGLDLPTDADGAPHVETTTPGGLRIAFDPVDTVRGFDPHWEPPSGSGRISLAFALDTPDDVDVLHDDLVTAGAPSRLAPFDAPWGQRYATVLDPDGNGVDLFSWLATPE